MRLDYYDCTCFTYVPRANVEEVKSYLEQRNVNYVYAVFDENTMEFGCIGSKRNVKIFDNIGKRFAKPLDKSTEM